MARKRQPTGSDSTSGREVIQYRGSGHYSTDPSGMSDRAFEKKKKRPTRGREVRTDGKGQNANG